MGKSVIPEKIEYFCDLCKSPLSKKNHDNYVIYYVAQSLDFSGNQVGQVRREYEICDECNKKFKDLIYSMSPNENI